MIQARNALADPHRYALERPPHAVCPPRAGRPAYEGNDEGEEELGVSKTRTALDEPDAVRVFVW